MSNITTYKFQQYIHDDLDKSTLSNNSIYTAYRDNKGNMWLGTYAGGVDVFHKDSNKSTTLNITHLKIVSARIMFPVLKKTQIKQFG
ncbi:MAG: hypothetical protein IPP79_24375 [Chitinophagaceae bacterium]|nr:hypothetical protein [Chitinophagaceae bacterium]